MPRLDVSLRGRDAFVWNYRHWARWSQPVSAPTTHSSNDQVPVRDLEWGGSGDARGSERSLARHGAPNRSMRSGVCESSAGDSSRAACASATSTPDARTTGGVLIVEGSPSTSITEMAVRPAMRMRIHAAHRIGAAPRRHRRPPSGCVPADPLTASLLPRSVPRVNRSTRRRPGRGPRWRTFVTPCRNTSSDQARDSSPHRPTGSGGPAPDSSGIQRKFIRL